MEKKVLMLMEKICKDLREAGVIDTEIMIKKETVLIGMGTKFESIGFVTFFMELEEKLSDLFGKEVILILDELLDLNSDETTLTVQNMIDYVLNKYE